MPVDTLHSHKTGLSPHHPLPVGTHLPYCRVKMIHNYSKEYYYILSLNKMSIILVNYPIRGFSISVYSFGFILQKYVCMNYVYMYILIFTGEGDTTPTIVNLDRK